MNLPPLLGVRELPEDVRRRVLDELVREASPNLCGRLFERCLLLLGSGHCGADNPIWKLACEKFGLRRMWAADWRATFQRLCRSLKMLRDRGDWSLNRALEVYHAFVQGRGERDIDREAAVLRDLLDERFLLIREALFGLGAMDSWHDPSWEAVREALDSGDVEAVKAALGTALNAGVRHLVLLVGSKGSARTLPAEQRLEYIRLLLEAGVRTDATSYGETVLRFAVSNAVRMVPGSAEVVKLLLDHGVNPNDGGKMGTPLDELVAMAAVYIGTPMTEEVFLQLTHMLLDYGANPSLRLKDGWYTALETVEDQRKNSKIWNSSRERRECLDSVIEAMKAHVR